MKSSEICELLSNILDIKVLKDEPMKKHTSFKIGGTADVLVIPKTVEAIKEVIFKAQQNDVPITIIGAGSNILVSDKGIRGITIKIGADFSDITLEGNIITAKSGASLAKISLLAAANSLSGFEFAGGIPGSLGGAVYMNAGAYGGEMKDVVIKTEYMDYSGNIFALSADEHEFGYRHSFFSDKDDFIILSSKISLTPSDEKTIKDKIKDLNDRRKEKQPLNYPSAGSAFKRPEGFFAAKLIEEAGLKGKSIGDAEVSEKHAGFIINKGSATAEDVLNLINYVKKIVLEKHGVMLDAEIKLIGEWDIY